MTALAANPHELHRSACPDFPRDALHGVVLPPAVMGWSGHRYVGSAVLALSADAVRDMPGVVSVVQKHNFVGVVAMTPVHARQAADCLPVQWSAAEASSKPPTAKGAGGADLNLAADTPTYTWRIAEKAAQGSVAVWVLNAHASVWVAEVMPDFMQVLRAELSSLLALPQESIAIFTQQSLGPITHEIAVLDAVADAALLSQQVQRPVVVTCTQHSTDGAVLTVQAAAATGRSDGALLFESPTPWAQRPSKARLLAHIGGAAPVAHASVQDAGEVCGRPDAQGLLCASVHDFNAVQVFAHESLHAEQAAQKGLHPIEERLGNMPQGRGRDLALAVVERARDEAQPFQSEGFLSGRGFATAALQCLDAQGQAQTVWSAWVADVAVDVSTGEIAVTRVVAGHDVQSLQPAQQAELQVVSSQAQPQMLEGAQRLLKDDALQDAWASGEPLAVQGASGTALAAADAGQLVTQGQLLDEGVTTLPAAAAIANAVQQATGVRLRNVPLDAQELRLALGLQVAPKAAKPIARWGWLGAGAAAVAGMVAMAWPLKSALPLTNGPDVSLYSAQAIERGRLVAAAGDCVVCHTVPGGQENAGGLGLPTPFGTIYTTNITPDNETGIGRWSYAAFERAMRHGVHQDGRQLYPAFPYTAFAKMNEGDMQALYGYLMSQPAVQAQAPKTELAFPYNMRSSLAGWNVLFHDAKPFEADRSKSVEWNRGAYLVDGAGHCAACHSPRNALGAEKQGVANYLAGGEAEGWIAPAINQLGSGARAWSKSDLVRYMREGYSANHGVAAGPMAPVIHGLAQLPVSDVEAIATYLLDLPGASNTSAAATGTEQAPKVAPASVSAPAVNASQAAMVRAEAAPAMESRMRSGERIYQSACAVCHDAGSGPTLWGAKPNLAHNTSVHAATPQNLLQVILHGIDAPASDALGYMPGFKDSFDNQQITDLLGYLRGRFAPEEKAWPDDSKLIEQLREKAH